MEEKDILNEEESQEELEEVNEETEEVNDEPEEELEDIDLEGEEQEIRRNIQAQNKKKKGKVVALIAIVMAVLVGITSCIALKKKNKKPNDKEPVKTTTVLTEEDMISIDDIGETVDLTDFTVAPEEIYSNPTGEVEPDKIVEKDGELFVDQEAANNKDKVGETSIDDKNGRLEVTPEGTVKEKEEEAQIKTPEGTVVTEKIDPNTKLPEGYVHDETLDKDVKEEDANKYVYVDQDYYSVFDGSLMYSKGQIVTQETLDKIKNDKNLTTVKPVIETTGVPETTSAPETTSVPETTSAPETTTPETESNIDSLGGVTNPDGTYTIYGIIYADKATFEAIMLSKESTVKVERIDGVIHLMTNENTKTK